MVQRIYWTLEQILNYVSCFSHCRTSLFHIVFFLLRRKLKLYLELQLRAKHVPMWAQVHQYWLQPHEMSHLMHHIPIMLRILQLSNPPSILEWVQNHSLFHLTDIILGLSSRFYQLLIDTSYPMHIERITISSCSYGLLARVSSLVLQTFKS